MAVLLIEGQPVAVGDLLHLSSGSGQARVASVSRYWVGMVWPWITIDPASQYRWDGTMAFPRQPDDHEWSDMPWRTDPPPERLEVGDQCRVFMPEMDVRVVDLHHFDPPQDVGSLPRPSWSLAVTPLGEDGGDRADGAVYQFYWETAEPVTFTRVGPGDGGHRGATSATEAS